MQCAQEPWILVTQVTASRAPKYCGLNCNVSNPDPYLRAQQHLAFGAGESKQLIMIAGGGLRDARIGRITAPNELIASPSWNAQLLYRNETAVFVASWCAPTRA